VEEELDGGDVGAGAESVMEKLGLHLKPVHEKHSKSSGPVVSFPDPSSLFATLSAMAQASFSNSSGIILSSSGLKIFMLQW
jgi:hypothetical protein